MGTACSVVVDRDQATAGPNLARGESHVHLAIRSWRQTRSTRIALAEVTIVGSVSPGYCDVVDANW